MDSWQKQKSEKQSRVYGIYRGTCAHTQSRYLFVCQEEQSGGTCL
jgi:hypothetical protein